MRLRWDTTRQRESKPRRKFRNEKEKKKHCYDHNISREMQALSYARMHVRVKRIRILEIDKCSLAYTQRLPHRQLWKLFLYLLCDANTSRNWRWLRQSCTRSRLTSMRICMLIIMAACRASPSFCITSESTLRRSSVRPYHRASHPRRHEYAWMRLYLCPDCRFCPGAV